MTPATRRRRAALALLTAAGLALAACSPGADNRTSDAEDDATTVTFRLWDETAVDAYEESFDAFTEQNPGIVVEIETVPWANYWDLLPQDIGAGTMADIFWTNTSNFGIYADNGDLIDLTDALGDDHDEWTASVVDLYERDGVQWGIPQLWDSIALFYNTELLQEAGIDPAELRWDPDGEQDTFLEAALALTVDGQGNTADSPDFDPEDVEVYAFNAQHDLQGVWLNFLAENGGQFQDENDQYTFASPEGEEAFGYLVDLINTHHVAPPAADTNQNPDYPRDLFIQGRLAMFQSGPYSLPHLADANLEWDLAPKLQGPQGRVSVVHGVAAVGNAGTDHLEETIEVLRWLGTAEGQRPLAETGAAFPGAVEAQDAYIEHWADEDVDVEVFVEAAEGQTVPAPLGPRANAGANAITPVFQEMFAGRIPVPEALQQAEDAANEAIAE